MEVFQEFLQAYKYLIYTVLLTLVTAIVIKNYWEEIKFWWVCTWYSFPVIGKLAKLSKDTVSIDDNGWFNSESTVCTDFNIFYNKFDKAEEEYENAESYLSKVNESGRKPFPQIMWVIIVTLVILEALGFSYVLAGFTIPGASESTQQYGAVGIAILISIVLVGFTHWTGHEIYENTLVKEIRNYWNNDRNDNKPDLMRKSISLGKDKEDDNLPRYTQILNRVNFNKKTPTWMISIITAILVISIAIGATYVRGQVLEKQLNEEITNIETNVYSAYPIDLVKSQENADNKGLTERQDNDRKGGWATFIILAILFVFIQIFGIIFGKIWGFVGIDSYKAYIITHNFSSKQEFINFFKRKKELIAKIAQQKLQLLQHKMYQNAISNGTSTNEMTLLKNKGNRTFLNYVVLTHQYSPKQNYIDSNSEKRELTPQQNISENIISEEKDKTSKILCWNCNEENPINSNYCKACGKSLELKSKVPTCPKCNTIFEDGVNFCSNDGSKLELV